MKTPIIMALIMGIFLMTFVMGGVPHWLPAVIEFQWSYSRS